MGEVYRARDTRLGRDVALKILPASLSQDPDRLHRFELEARTASAPNHPNILTIHDVGQPDPSTLRQSSGQAGSGQAVSYIVSGTDERTTLPYDVWVIAILAFVWLTPPDWLGDPTGGGWGLIGRIGSEVIGWIGKN